jgi:hypothetical protein
MRSSPSPDRKALINKIYKVSQSNQSFLVNGRLTLEAYILRNLSGSGSNIFSPHSGNRSIVTVPGGFLGRALAISKYYADISDSLKRRAYRKPSSGLQKKHAEELSLRFSGLVGGEAYRVIEQKFPGYQLIVVGPESEKVFAGAAADKQLVVKQRTGDLYDAVTSLSGFMKGGYFCVKCWKAFRNKGQHVCKFKKAKVKRSSPSFCNHCETLAEETHEDTCDREMSCYLCKRKYSANINHICTEYTCKQCGVVYDQQPHSCNLEDVDPFTKWWFYLLELNPKCKDNPELQDRTLYFHRRRSRK